MLLRLRVRLPDRPGSLGQVARTLGVTGADIVQMVVLERVGGRAVDDFTVIWPAVAPVDRILAGLAAIPGVTVEGVWRSVGAPAVNGADAELVGQVAANPSDGIATLVDAIPGLLAARGGEDGSPQAPAFHVTEVDRLAQLVRASALVLGSRLDDAPGPARPIDWPINRAARFAAIDT